MSNDTDAFSTHGSGILTEALTISPCKSSEATHFALCYGSKIKFLINLKGGIPHLRATVAAYNKKLAILLHLLPFTPWGILQCCKMGYFTNVQLHPSVSQTIPSESLWNILVGAYDNAQKIVIQCYHHTPGNNRSYVKVGNAGSTTQMENEILFLRRAAEYKTFSIPTLRTSYLIREGYPFNIQVTDEFSGEKIEPALTQDIYNIASEIAGPVTLIDGVPHTFSHGDFAPWNIRHANNTYTVFDWEHCGMRPAGYDIIFFCIMVEIAIHHYPLSEAYERALHTVQSYLPDFAPNRDLILSHFKKTVKTILP